MSSRQITVRAEERARKDFENYMQRLQLELAMHSPRRHLDVLVRLLELLVEQTGGSFVTADYRDQLATAKKQVALRGNLHLVRSLS